MQIKEFLSCTNILRLEVFARHMQTYEYDVELCYGQFLKIGEDINLVFSPDKFHRKLVHVGVKTKKYVKKSVKNYTDDNMKIET